MDKNFLRVAAADPEIRVADTEYNADAIINTVKAAAKEGVQALVFAELCVTGYTCGDLFFQRTLTRGAECAVKKIAERTADTGMLVFVGLPVRCDGKLYNVCAALQGGKILGLIPKTHYPEYGEFNELRYFTRADEPRKIDFAGQVCDMAQMLIVADGDVTIGAEICEDLWAPAPPSSDCAAVVTFNLSASSEEVGKAQTRRTLICGQSLRTASAYVYCDAGRGESTTDLVFSGHSVICENGRILSENSPFKHDLLTIADIDIGFLSYLRLKNNTVLPKNSGRVRADISLPEYRGKLKRDVSRLPFVPESADKEKQAELILNIQSEGLCKRISHTGLKKLVLGVSGGLDSALALLVCRRALKAAGLPDKSLLAVSMPCFGTSAETADNALALAKESRADHRTIDIRDVVEKHLCDIGHTPGVYDTTYENAQARMRTMILMDLANAENGLVVGTGDLSEAALGWCTYNGDHMAMYNVNASVPKTLVKFLTAYEAERIGGKTREVLLNILGTDISPELLPAENGKISQKTEQIIGSFELNDFFLYYAVKHGCPPQAVLEYAAAAFGGNADGYRESLVKFYKRFFSSQFKRSCCPDGVKAAFSLSPRGDWRMPSDACVKLWVEAVEKSGGCI